MAQTSGLHPKNKVRACFDCKMLDVANWVARLSAEDGPRQSLSYETPSVTSQGALKVSSVAGQPPSLVRDHFSSPRVVAKTCQHTEGFRPSPQRPQCSNLSEVSNVGWGAHFEQDSVKGLWSDREKRLHINVLELNVVIGVLALKGFKVRCQNQTMLVATDNSILVGYINKQGGTY